MVKSAGFLKRLKNLKDFVGKGASFINDNIVKPLRPIVDTALDMTGFGAVKPILDMGSNFIDETFGNSASTMHNNNRFKKGIELGADIFMDTQRAPKDKKYGGFW